MMSLVRASGEGGVVPAQKKCFDSADAADAAPSTTSATTSTTAARANERADLTGCTSTGRCEVPRLATERITREASKMTRDEGGDRGLRRLGLLLVPRRGGGARARHAVREAVGPARRRRGRRRARRVLPAARPRARAPAARDPLPRERL